MNLLRMSLISSLLLTFIAVSAHASDAEKVSESKTRWEALKKECGGNYSYKVSWSSFAGFGHTTTIVVENNKVVSRTFQEFNLREIEPVAPGEEPAAEKSGWVETGDEIGSHKEGAAPKTLDELYAEAAKIAVKQLSPDERRYVRTDKQGLLLSCFYVDTRIADDAPTTGVIINSITLKK